MTTKEFAQKAIKNGYTGENCNGWEWIRENLKELDYIFQTEEYKKCNGMEYKCMEFLENGLEEDEKRAIGTAWYLNNEREQLKKKKEKIRKFNDDGFYNIESDKKLHGKKIEFIVDSSGNMFGSIDKYTGRLFWSNVDKRLMAMKSRCRRRGVWIDNKNVYIKLNQLNK